MSCIPNMGNVIQLFTPRKARPLPDVAPVLAYPRLNQYYAKSNPIPEHRTNLRDANQHGGPPDEVYRIIPFPDRAYWNRAHRPKPLAEFPAFQCYVSGTAQDTASRYYPTEEERAIDHAFDALKTLEQGILNPTTIPAIARSGRLYQCADALEYVSKKYSAKPHLQMPLVQAIYGWRFDKGANAAAFASNALGYVEHPILQRPLIDTILAGDKTPPAENALSFVRDRAYKKDLQFFILRKKTNNRISGPSPR